MHEGIINNIAEGAECTCTAVIPRQPGVRGTSRGMTVPTDAAWPRRSWREVLVSGFMQTVTSPAAATAAMTCSRSPRGSSEAEVQCPQTTGWV